MGAHDRRNVDAVEQAPLRAKGLGKLRLPARVAAREANVRVMRAASNGVSNGDLGANIGGELAGCQAREGAVVLTPGEVAKQVHLHSTNSLDTDQLHSIDPDELSKRAIEFVDLAKHEQSR